MFFIHENRGKEKNLHLSQLQLFTIISLHCCVLNEVFGCVSSKTMLAALITGRQDGGIVLGSHGAFRGPG